jgi:hypothetical protein
VEQDAGLVVDDAAAVQAAAARVGSNGGECQWASRPGGCTS